MSMEINGRYSQYQTAYEERLKAGQEKTRETENGQNEEKASDRMPVLQDEYISSEKSGAKPSGLYRLGQDEEGRKKVFFEQPEVNSDNPEQPAEKCTANTDKVDGEIKKLREKKQQLEQQIQSAAGDEAKVKELEKKLAQVESELSQKDNDTYRRQNAVITGRA